MVSEINHLLDYGARFYDPAIGRWHVVDPAIENNHFEHSPYIYVYNDPISLSDPFGLDSLERATAINQMQEHIDEESPYEWDHKASTDPDGTAPGEGGNCSSTLSNCVVEAGSPNPSDVTPDGDLGSGILNIEGNTNRVSNNNDIQAGNIITFRITGGYEYHGGMVTDVTNNNGNISITFGHNQGGTGGTEDSFTIGDGSTWDTRTHGFYKWDPTPDNNTQTQPARSMQASSKRSSLRERIASGLKALESKIASVVF